ncbi:MAG: GNAT family N-acetyltransferase [Ignavibacteriales bacterium]
MLNHIGTQPIKTERLTLRRFTLNDVKDAYIRWTSCKDSEFWEPPHKNIKETEQAINEYVKNYDNADWYMWAVVLNNDLIGLVCGNEINEDLSPAKNCQAKKRKILKSVKRKISATNKTFCNNKKPDLEAD